jgi:hypothetical protein
LVIGVWLNVSAERGIKLWTRVVLVLAIAPTRFLWASYSRSF